jgi:lipopolysaccharide export system protein LptA
VTGLGLRRNRAGGNCDNSATSPLPIWRGRSALQDLAHLVQASLDMLFQVSAYPTGSPKEHVQRRDGVHCGGGWGRGGVYAAETRDAAPEGVVIATFPCRDRQANGGQPGKRGNMVSRGMAAVALLLVLAAPGLAQDSRPAGRITATFYQAQRAAQPSKGVAAMPDANEAEPALATMISPFKVDPAAPIHIEADIVETSAGQAVFSGDVKLHQGDFLLRATALTAFHLGELGVRNGGEWRAEQLTRVEVEKVVLVTSKNGQTATGRLAAFDVMANSMLLGGGVVVTRSGQDQLRPDVVVGEQLKVDLTTGMLRFEGEQPKMRPTTGMYRFGNGKAPGPPRPANPTPSP